MEVSNDFLKIYILGPKSAGKSTFMQKYFSKELQMFSNLIIESSEMILPEKFQKIFLVLPKLEKLKARADYLEIEKTYWSWYGFYSKNSSKIDIKLVEEF